MRFMVKTSKRTISLLTFHNFLNDRTETTSTVSDDRLFQTLIIYSVSKALNIAHLGNGSGLPRSL